MVFVPLRYFMMCLVASMMDGDGFVTYLATMLVAVAMSGLVQHARYVSCPITVSSHFCFVKTLRTYRY